MWLCPVHTPPPGTTPTHPQTQVSVTSFRKPSLTSSLDSKGLLPRMVSCAQLWLCFQCPAGTCILLGVLGSFRVDAMKSASPRPHTMPGSQYMPHTLVMWAERWEGVWIGCGLKTADGTRASVIRKQSLHQASQASLSQGQKTQQMPPRKLTRSLNWKAQVAQAHLDYCYSEHVFLLFLSLPFSLSLHPSFLHLWILLLLYGSHSVTALGRRREGCHRRSPSSRAEQVSLPWLLQQFPRISTA